MVIEPPALNLEASLEAYGLPYVDVRRPSGETDPVRVCFTRQAAPNPHDLADHLADQNIEVRALYEVGGCRRP